jgi:flagellar basal-body rod protein FlgC
MFGTLDTATSGATVARQWLDAIADNVANMNTVRPAGEEPFRARLVMAQSVGEPGQVGAGVAVAGIRLKGGEPVRVFDPDHPLADEEGMVTRANVDLAEEMTNMLMAQRSYQANLAVLDRARDSYAAALKIGSR